MSRRVFFMVVKITDAAEEATYVWSHLEQLRLWDKRHVWHPFTQMQEWERDEQIVQGAGGMIV